MGPLNIKVRTKKKIKEVINKIRNSTVKKMGYENMTEALKDRFKKEGFDILDNHEDWNQFLLKEWDEWNPKNIFKKEGFDILDNHEDWNQFLLKEWDEWNPKNIFKSSKECEEEREKLDEMTLPENHEELVKTWEKHEAHWNQYQNLQIVLHTKNIPEFY